MSCDDYKPCQNCDPQAETYATTNCWPTEPQNFGITDEDFDAACAKAEKAIQERAKETSYSSGTPIADFYEPLTFEMLGGTSESRRMRKLVKEYLEGPAEGSED